MPWSERGRARTHPAPRSGLLHLTLGDVTYRFATLADLDFALAARTSVPAERLRQLYASDIPALEADSIKLRTLVLQLDGILEDLDAHGIAVSRSLQRTGVGMISKDHEWRAIFGQLQQHEDQGAGYARLVLVRYLEFLAERREMLDAVLAQKRACAAQRARTTGPDAATIVTTAPATASTARPALSRLPHGRAVVLELAAGRQIEIALARHRFALSHERDWTLVTADGQRFVLQPGLNSVGRSRENTVPVDDTLRNVSRTHLLAEPLGPDRIALTDLSSSGTFVAATAIAS
ncbi:MAG: FHA domain-containing protein [Gammaproteobacteria bacterium]